MERYKKCPACGVYFDTWHPLEVWSRQACLSAPGGVTHYEAYNESQSRLVPYVHTGFEAGAL